MKSTQKNRIVYGNVEFPDDEFDPKHGKFRVTMFVDLDVLDEIRRVADREGIGYQTWINRKLRRVVLGEEGIEKRVAALEAAVFKKRKLQKS
jgi:uncharacterized protein (DUF4415 family)